MLNIKSIWIYAAIGGTTLVAVALGVSVIAKTGNFSRSTPTPVAQASATPEPISPLDFSASIGGTVWHDMCASSGSITPIIDTIPLGCVFGQDGVDIFGNGIREEDELGLSAVQISIGLGVCPSFGLSEAITNANGAFLFENLSAGTYCVSIDPKDERNVDVLSQGQWTTAVSGTGIGAITVTISSGEQFKPLNFGWDFDLLPTPDPTPSTTVPTPTSSPSSNAGACSDRAQFVKDVTIPDNTRVDPGKSFEKIWRLKNIGTCTWTTSYAVAFINGDRMSASESVSLKEDVLPGEIVDIKVTMKAPSSNGTYRGNWKIKNERGSLFGIGDKYESPFWVQIVVGQGGAGGLYTWKGEYFNNRKLEGAAALVRYDPSIDFNWKRASPDKGISDDNFSVRWTGKLSFSTSGIYRFRVLVDDGVRLWVDKHLILDSWKDGSERELTVDVLLEKGSHDIRLEYYERRGDARIRLKWEKISSPTYPDWRGKYWTNRELKGNPLFVRNDRSIDFSWGSKSPATGIPADGFSARWTRKVKFEAGTYRFSAYADDGIRIYLDGMRILNEWHSSDGTTIYAMDLVISAGEHKLTVEYYENAGDARVKVWWEKAQPTATPTPTSTESPPPADTATPTATSTVGNPSTETATPTPISTADVPAMETQTPADTPTPTATETPTPTATVTPTPTPTGIEASEDGLKLLYEFVSDLCEASWRSGAGALPCPGQEGAPEGAVSRSQHQVMENGINVGLSGIVLYPQHVNNGWIEGRFPAFSVQQGDRFRATIGCISGNAVCDVSVELNYREASSEVKNLGAWHEAYDAKVRVIDLDLTPLAGKTVEFVLAVYAEKSSVHNQLIWTQPGIWR